MKGNFGCGPDVLSGYINYDLYPYDKRVKKLDMIKIPYDVGDNFFDEQICRHTLEHLDINPLEVMKEFYRMGKPESKVIVELPIFGPLVSHNRWYHTRNYMNPLIDRRVDNAYAQNLFILKQFKKKKRKNIWMVLWGMKTRFLSWVDSFFWESYEWDLEVNK